MTPVPAGLQHERTALAWERTSIAMIVAGVLFTRYAASTAHWTIAMAGLAQTMIGAAILVWAGLHYEDLHGSLTSEADLVDADIVHPGAARLIGLAAVVFTGASFLLAVAQLGTD